MRFLWLLLLAARARAKEQIDICATCECGAASLGCAKLNLFELFETEDWQVVNSTAANVLAAVSFDQNGIEVVTKFPALPIRVLSFRRNKIREIQQRAFENLSLLEKLDLSENRLEFKALDQTVFAGRYDPHEYQPLRSLKWLSLASNQLHSMDPDIFEHMPNLEVLSLANNPFKVLDSNTASVISTIPLLAALDMSYMGLKALPELMFHAPNHLKNLTLTGNSFTSLPEAIQYSVNLVSLILDENPIDRIGDEKAFPPLPKLESLSISSMPALTAIGKGAFKELPALLNFFCRDNPKLAKIDSKAFRKYGNDSKTASWPPLRVLDLHNNSLSTLDLDLLRRWDEVQEVDLRWNPWRCDCVNQWMVDVLVSRSLTSPNSRFEDIKCDRPAAMKGKLLSDLASRHSHLRCEDYYGNQPQSDGPILVGIFIGLVIGVPLVMALLYVSRRGCCGVFGYRPNPNECGRAFYKRAHLNEDVYI